MSKSINGYILYAFILAGFGVSYYLLHLINYSDYLSFIALAIVLVLTVSTEHKISDLKEEIKKHYPA